jgi:hypothetical protein
MNKRDSYQSIDRAVIAEAHLMNFIMVPILLLHTLEIEHPQVRV